MFKSRTLAGEACDGGKVKIEGTSVKPSRIIKPGEIISVQQGYIKREFKVIELLDKRVGAPLVKNYALDITPPEELAKRDTERFVSYKGRFQGSGRPTKKDRRLIDKVRIK